MPQFSFIARDSSGQQQTGVLEAGSSSDVLGGLRSRGWIVLSVRENEASGSGVGSALARLRPGYWLPATRLDVEIGLQQIATMLRSGLTLLTSLRTAADQARRPAMGQVWRRVADRIESGAGFAEALETRQTRVPPIIIQLVRVGEQTGTLDSVLTRGAEQLERARSLRARLLTALTYPAFVFLAAVGVALFMVVSVIPKLQRFISLRGRRLPAITQTLLDVTAWINQNGTLLLIITGAVLLAGLLTYRTSSGRLRMDTFFLRMPIIGGLLRLAGTAMMARGLSMLLQSGIALLGALETTSGLLTNRAMRRRIDETRQSIMEGGTLADGLMRGTEFLPMLGRMASVGEATGTLDAVLAEVARFHEEQLAAAVRRFSALIEPIIILVVGGIVGFVYIAFFMALFALTGGGR